MFVQYTYQDWLNADDKLSFIQTVIASYKGSIDFRHALQARDYFTGHNTALRNKYIVRADIQTGTDARGMTKRNVRKVQVQGNRIPCGFFRHAVMQQNQYILSNGVTLQDDETKRRLGLGFDKTLQQLGEYALLSGVSYGFWNADHLEPISAAADHLSGCVALVDEMTSSIQIAIQFWQLSADKPVYVRLFEPDGVTVYRKKENWAIVQDKRAYVHNTITDAAGTIITGTSNYSALPVIPLYANEEKKSQLTPSIKSKIDATDVITSDFADNLERANDVYWVLNNFGGSVQQALEVMQQINSLKLVANQSDGLGGVSAQPRTIQVPYAARQTALQMLRKELYADYMALDMDALTGGSLTNVAIKTAMANLDLKADHYQWQLFSFVQSVLKLLGVQTQIISFKRQTISNDTETVQAIYTMRNDIDQRTALTLNPYINADQIDGILEDLDAQAVSGMSGIDSLQKTIDKIGAGAGGDDV